MTARTTNSQAEKGCPKGVNPIHYVLHMPFRRDRTILGINAVVATKAGRNLIGECRLGQHVTSQLFDDKSVVGLVRVKGHDHPVSPNVVIAVSIVLVTIGVGIARHF